MSPNALKLSYNTVNKMLHDIAWKWVKNYGGDYEETLAEVHLHFVKACHDFDRDRSKFTTWTWNSVWWGLLDQRKQIVRQSMRMKQELIDLRSIPDRRRFDIRELMDRLGSDAQHVVSVAMSSKKWKKAVRTQTQNARNLMCIHIRYKLTEEGWTNKRINKAFKEVGRAL